MINLCRLVYLCLRYSLEEFLLKDRYRYLLWINPYYIFYNYFIPRGRRLTLALQKAGPLFVKFGQILSTRGDLLPQNVIAELTKLQDQVPPAPKNCLQKIIQEEYRKHHNEIFQSIDKEPLASASIAQVHAATLHDGTSVVIKILRPNIKKQLHRDIKVLYWVANRFKPWGKKMVEEIESTLTQEINLLNEAAHAEKIKENVQIRQSKKLLIPKVYWDYSTEKMLVLERIYGIPILNISALEQAGISLAELAHQCIEIFFEQIFYDNYFHADLHPGNIFIDTTQAKKPVIQLVDFGIIGTLAFKDRRYIAQNMTALIDKDFREVARLHKEAGWTPTHIPEIAFAHALQRVCEPILNKPLKDISLAQLLLGLLQTAKNYEIQLQPQLLLLQKTLLNIESLCRHLDPNVNMWAVMQPILNTWLKQQLSPIHWLQRVIQEGWSWLKKQDL